MIEKRKFRRIDRNYVVSYTAISPADSKFDLSQTKDVSEGGLLFIADRKFEKGTVLKIKLRLPEFLDYVIVKVEVLGSTLTGKTRSSYETRARFVEIDQKVKEAIKKQADYYA